jgi:hypothetical protein
MTLQRNSIVCSRLRVALRELASFSSAMRSRTPGRFIQLACIAICLLARIFSRLTICVGPRQPARNASGKLFMPDILEGSHECKGDVICRILQSTCRYLARLRSGSAGEVAREPPATSPALRQRPNNPGWASPEIVKGWIRAMGDMGEDKFVGSGSTLPSGSADRPSTMPGDTARPLSPKRSVAGRSAFVFGR